MSDALQGALERLNGLYATQHAVIRHRTGDVRLTFADLHARSSRIAHNMRHEGLDSASRVAVLMHTNMDTIATLIAVLRMGATIVPVFPYQRPQQRGASRQSLTATLRASRAEALVLPQSQVNDYAMAVAFDVAPPKLLAIESLRDKESPAELPTPANPIAPALIQFSSGSTSSPKGIVIERDALMAAVAGPSDRLAQIPADIFGSWLPLYHDYGLVGGLFQAILSGSSIWLMPPQDFIRAPLDWLRLLSDSNATITGAPNFSYDLVCSKLTTAVSIDDLDLSFLTAAINAAEPVNADTVNSFHGSLARYGLRDTVVQPTYGLAENCAAATMPARHSPLKKLQMSDLPTPIRHEASDLTYRAGSFVALGAPLRGTEVRIVRNGEEVAPGTIGLIFVSGRAAARHFVNAQGEFYPSTTEFGIDSGDLGMMWNGELYVVGRTKEMFKHGGRSFSPADLEASLVATLALQPHSICVYSTNPGLQGHDKVNVMFELAPAKLKERFDELTDQIQRHIRTEFGIPVAECIAVRKGQLPRTTSGKLRRVHLRQLHESGTLESEIDVLERSPPPG